MSFVISKDNGDGKPPSFLGGTLLGNTNDWVALGKAHTFMSESMAQSIIDNGSPQLDGCIVMPFDETLMQVSNERPVEVISGMEPDTEHLD
jgi:hypothetical protein